MLANCSHIVQLTAVVDNNIANNGANNNGTVRQSVTNGPVGPYIIMEYLENGSLENMLESIAGSDPLPLAFLLSVFLCSKYC